jgi:hypothetical protein
MVMRACNPGVASVRTASRNLISLSVTVVAVDAGAGVYVEMGTATYAGAEGVEAKAVVGRTEEVEGERTDGILVGHRNERKRRPASSPPASESSSEGASDGVGELRAFNPSEGATSSGPRTGAWYLVDVSIPHPYPHFYLNHRDESNVRLLRHCLHVTHLPGSTKL